MCCFKVTYFSKFYNEIEVSFHRRSKTDLYIQDVPGGKVNFLGGHSIGHSKQKCL